MVVPRPICFLLVTFVPGPIFPKFGNFTQILIQNQAKSKNFPNFKVGSRDMTIFGEWFW